MESTKRPLVPQNVEAEQALLGCVLVNPSLFSTFSLSACDFYIQRYGWVWEAFLKLSGTGLAIDFLTVTDCLDKMGRLIEFGGPSKIVDLINAVPSTLHADSYALLIQDMAARRKMIKLANEMADLALDFEVDLESVRPVLLDDLLRANRPPGGAVHISEWVDRTMDEVREAQQTGGIMDEVLTTGFGDIDAAIGSLDNPGGLDVSDGTMLLLGGMPGAGKTILASNLAAFLQKQAPGAVYSLEMMRRRSTLRMLSQATGASVWGMKRGKLNPSQMVTLERKASEIRQHQLFISDSTDWTTASLMADLLRLKYEHGIRWYIVDYMALLQDEIQHGSKEFERERQLSKRLQRINRKLGLCSIIIHSMNKDGEFSGAQGIQHDVDIAAILEPDPDEKPGDRFIPMQLRFTKIRDSENGLPTVTILKRKDRPAFESVFQTPVSSSKNGYHTNGNGNGNGHHKENPLTAPVLLTAPSDDDRDLPWTDR